jgi:hypothetical protein
MIWNDRRAPRITRSMAFTGRRGVIHPLQCPTWPPAWADSGLSPSGRAGCALAGSARVSDARFRRLSIDRFWRKAAVQFIGKQHPVTDKE